MFSSMIMTSYEFEKCQMLSDIMGSRCMRLIVLAVRSRFRSEQLRLTKWVPKVVR